MPVCALINGSRPRGVIIPMTFPRHLQSGRCACGLWRTRKVNAKQPLRFLFLLLLFVAALAPPSFDEWMCVIPAGCNMYELLCWHHFVAPAVMLSIVKQEHTTKSRQVWNTFCQLLSARPSLAAVCSGALPMPRDLLNSFFGNPQGGQCTPKFARSCNDSSLVSGWCGEVRTGLFGQNCPLLCQKGTKKKRPLSVFPSRTLLHCTKAGLLGSIGRIFLIHFFLFIRWSQQAAADWKENHRICLRFMLITRGPLTVFYWRVLVSWFNSRRFFVLHCPRLFFFFFVK